MPLGGEAELGCQAAQGVRQHRLLFDQQRPGRVQGKYGLLLHTLDGHEPHLGPGPGHAQGRGICGVVLLAFFHERPDRLGRDQLHLVPKAAQQARPVMAGTTGLEDHGASGLLLEERDQLAPAQLALEHHPSTLVNAVDLEDRLCGVQPDHACRHRGRLLFRFARPEVRHIDA
jgi:hypothetical protein